MDERPTNLADALDRACTFLDGFDSLIKVLNNSDVTGVRLDDGRVIPLPTSTGDGMQRDLREAARRAREVTNSWGYNDEAVVDYLWPERQS